MASVGESTSMTSSVGFVGYGLFKARQRSKQIRYRLPVRINAQFNFRRDPITCLLQKPAEECLKNSMRSGRRCFLNCFSKPIFVIRLFVRIAQTELIKRQ